MTKLINKTKITLNIYDEAGEEFLLSLAPDGAPANLPMTNVSLPKLNGLPVSMTQYGEPSELPAYEAGTFYIVSLPYRMRSDRTDLLSVGPLLRDPEGYPYGCRGLITSNVNANKAVWRFEWVGYYGSLIGLFLATNEEIKEILGKEIHFGEVQGEYSDISLVLDDKYFKKLTNKPSVVQVFEHEEMETGINPVRWYQQQQQEFTKNG